MGVRGWLVSWGERRQSVRARNDQARVDFDEWQRAYRLKHWWITQKVMHCWHGKNEMAVHVPHDEPCCTCERCQRPDSFEW